MASLLERTLGAVRKENTASSDRPGAPRRVSGGGAGSRASPYAVSRHVPATTGPLQYREGPAGRKAMALCPPAGRRGPPRRPSRLHTDTKVSRPQRPDGGSWKHDRYGDVDEAGASSNASRTGPRPSAGRSDATDAASPKLMITNLHYEVSERELEVRPLSKRPGRVADATAQPSPPRRSSLSRSAPLRRAPRSKYGYNLLLPPCAELRNSGSNRRQRQARERPALSISVAYTRHLLPFARPPRSFHSLFRRALTGQVRSLGTL